MILVDDAGGDWPAIAHAPWNGCNLADFVMPFFLFIVGVSIALALKVFSPPILHFKLLRFDFQLETSPNSSSHLQFAKLLSRNLITHLFYPQFRRLMAKAHTLCLLLLALTLL